MANRAATKYIVFHCAATRPSSDIGVDRMAANDEARRSAAVAAAIRALPERQRAAIVLTYYEELPNAEAAEAMEMNIKAFESLLHRARAALRQAWTAQGDAP